VRKPGKSPDSGRGIRKAKVAESSTAEKRINHVDQTAWDVQVKAAVDLFKANPVDIKRESPEESAKNKLTLTDSGKFSDASSEGGFEFKVVPCEWLLNS
jgi:hypothetical protein